ncbi:MAG: glycyl-radical enzyme activating protein [Candidatus Aminicenantes bacterium]|nr:MAG: glycyl-radical enzyme activating protein [Candidatus Aminicenantes bacterium]
MHGTIFDIKRYAIHDGPGIRTTVFFKGCTLNCQWCHNPEGIKFEHEIMFRPELCAAECWDCVPRCPKKAINENGTIISIEQKKCDLCGICGDVCAYESVEIVGRDVTVAEIMKEVEKDRIFYDESGGGVTISGGEPLAQGDFLLSLLEKLNEKGIHTAVDTSGFVPYEILSLIIERADLILYDLKVMNEHRHRIFTGESNTIILENLRRLSEKGSNLIIRMPVLKGLNDDPENIQSMVDFLLPLNKSRQINLLPFHRGGEGKLMRLNKKSPLVEFKTPSEKKLRKIKGELSSHGFHVKIGG